MRARVLAADLPGRKFAAWVQAELYGYRGGTVELPEYRIIGVTNRGNFLGGWRITDAVLPIDHLPPETRDQLAHHRFEDGVGTLEAFLKKGIDNLACPWSDGTVRAYARHPGVEFRGCTLTDAHKVLPVPAVEGVLHAVRTRLLEFLLQLRKQHPEMDRDDGKLSEMPPEEETSLVERTIYNHCNFAENQSMADHQINAAGGINVGGDFVVADAVQNSFNKVNDSQASSEVKVRFKELSQAIDEICSKLPPDKASEAVSDFETLAKEVTKPTPRKEWLKTAGESLIGLATTVGNATVAFAVKAILEHYLSHS